MCTGNPTFLIKPDLNVLSKSTAVVISSCLSITNCLKEGYKIPSSVYKYCNLLASVPRPSSLCGGGKHLKLAPILKTHTIMHNREGLGTKAKRLQSLACIYIWRLIVAGF